MKSNDDFDIKKEKINGEIIDFANFINKIEKKYINNNDSINCCIQSHKKFYKFVESAYVFEIYIWEELKEIYRKIKKKVTTSKNKFKDILTKFTELYSYYSFNNRIEIEKTIKNLENKKNNMCNNFINLKNIHSEITNKVQIYSRNKLYLKIQKKYNKIDNLIKRLNFYHDEINFIKDKMKELNTDGKNLHIDIQLLSKKN